MINIDSLERPRNEDDSISLHQRILNDIRGKIISGEWSPGHRIPFEHELTVQYNCSRMTVNKALSQLARSGLLERHRRSGSFVRRPRSQAAVLEIHDIRAEVEALGLNYRYELVSTQKRRSRVEDGESLGPVRPKSVIELSCLHFAGDTPFCSEDRLISLDAVPEAASEDFASTIAGQWLLGHVPWSSAEHRISAAAADTKIAKTLDINVGAPCLVVERRTWSADAPVTYARFVYSAESHSVLARFEPQ